MMTKRLWALVLAFALALGTLPAAVAAGDSPFDDISSRDSYYDAVLWAYENNVTAGTSATQFSPNATCTRGQVVTFLWRAMGKPAPQSADNPFTDIHPGDYFYDAVLWAVEQGITAGTSGDTFSPDATCIGAQVVTFLWRTMGKPAAGAVGTVAEGYADSAYYKTAVAWADRGGLFLLNGRAFDPDAFSPRSEIVTYLYLTLDGDVRTPNQALADMTGWGANVSDIYMDNEIDNLNPKLDLGYATQRPMTEPFGLALNYWDGSFEWIAYHEPHEGMFTASAAMPAHDPAKPRADWVDSLFFAEFFTNTPNQQVEVTLKNTRIVLADGSSVPLPIMDGKYSCVTGSDADANGWYRVALEFDRFKLPEPGAEFDGARVETTLVSDLTFRSPEDKAEYYIQVAREKKYDPQKAIDNVLNEGTNIIRLPVSWTPFVNDTTFEIDKAWLDKVAEGVDYILQNNAYCILNLHNDYLGKSFVGDHWETRWMDARYKEYVDRRFESIWRQIAEYFKNYPRKLMFETCNEPTMEWYAGVEEGYFEGQRARVNELNRIFVETVRSTGGKNGDRILNVVAAEYQTAKTLESMIPPEDSYLMMQVHSYDQIEAREPGFDAKAETDQFFAAVDAFVARTGVPVIIGEVGVSHLKPEDTYLNEITYFFRQAKQRGIPVLWWEDFHPVNEWNKDDLAHLGRIYWLYDKDADKWTRHKILQTIKDATK